MMDSENIRMEFTEPNRAITLLRTGRRLLPYRHADADRIAGSRERCLYQDKGNLVSKPCRRRIDTGAERVFLVGENGQGKTNFLEAIYYLIVWELL